MTLIPTQYTPEDIEEASRAARLYSPVRPVIASVCALLFAMAAGQVVGPFVQSVVHKTETIELCSLLSSAGTYVLFGSFCYFFL
jgi:hypothetical protein